MPRGSAEAHRSDEPRRSFNAFDGCGDGQLNVLASGMIDKVYNLWNETP